MTFILSEAKNLYFMSSEATNEIYKFFASRQIHSKRTHMLLKHSLLIVLLTILGNILGACTGSASG